MMNTDTDILGWIILIICGFVLGVVIGSEVTDLHLTKAVIENGCGQYNQTTGNFEWMNRNEQ